MSAKSAKAKAAEDAHTIHERFVAATQAEVSLWPHQAQALLDMRETKGWQALGFESFADWLIQTPFRGGSSKARKLIATLTAFNEAGVADLSELGRADWSKLAVTAPAVRTKAVKPKRAIADAVELVKSELEVRYSESDSLDATAEPAKWKCPVCKKINRGTPPKGVKAE